MGSEHLPALPPSDEVTKDSFWAATRSKFVLHPDDKENNFNGSVARKNRIALTRKLPPLESKPPEKKSFDSGFSDQSHVAPVSANSKRRGRSEGRGASSEKSPEQVYVQPVEISPDFEAQKSHVPSNQVKVQQPSERPLSNIGVWAISAERARPKSQSRERQPSRAVDESKALDGKSRERKHSSSIEALHESKLSSTGNLSEEVKVPVSVPPDPKFQGALAKAFPPSSKEPPYPKTDVRSKTSSARVSSSNKPIETVSSSNKPVERKSSSNRSEEKDSSLNMTVENISLSNTFAAKMSSSNKPIEDVPSSNNPMAKVSSSNKPAPRVLSSNKPVARVSSSNKPAPRVLSSNKPVAKVSSLNKPVTRMSTSNKPAAKVSSSNKSAERLALWQRTRKPLAGASRVQPKPGPVQKPAVKKSTSKVDTGVRDRKAPGMRRLPLMGGRKSPTRDRKPKPAADSSKSRVVFDRKGNFVRRRDRPPPARAKPQPKPQAPKPHDLRRRYLGRKAPRQAAKPNALAGPPKQAQLNQREAGRWRRLHKKFGAEPTARRRVTRHDRYLQRVEDVQLKAALLHNETLAERARRREQSKWRQAAQLWKVRDRFREEQAQRWRRQWVTPKATRHEVADRHLYGLPEDELAPVFATPGPAAAARKKPIERFDYEERRRVNIRRYAAHLGLDHQERAWDRRDARMPSVREAPERRIEQSGNETYQRTKGMKTESKNQGQSLEIMGAGRNQSKEVGVEGTRDRSRDRRVYQAATQGQTRADALNRHPVIPVTSRTSFATKLTAKTKKHQAPKKNVKPPKNLSHQTISYQPPQLPKREKGLGSITSLRTLDFLENDPELDTVFDAFDKARIKYNIDLEDNDT